MHFVPVAGIRYPEGVEHVAGFDRVRLSSPSGTAMVTLVEGLVVIAREGLVRFTIRRKRWFGRDAVLEVGDRFVETHRLRRGDVIQAELGEWRMEWVFQPDANLSTVGRGAMAASGWAIGGFALIAGATLAGDVVLSLMDMSNGGLSGRRNASVIVDNAHRLYPSAVEPFTYTYSPYLKALGQSNRQGVDPDRFTQEWLKTHGNAGQGIDVKAGRESQ